MRVGEKVICYNDKNDGEKLVFHSITLEVGQSFIISKIRKEIVQDFNKKEVEYVSLHVSAGDISFPIRKHGLKKKNLFGISIAYFDKFFITEKEYRKRKLKRINNVEKEDN